VYLTTFVRQTDNPHLAWGAQNVSAFANGAYTGEISTAMLRDLGCTYAIVGHSERRQLFGETDAMVATKARKCAEGDVTPIVCVGETEPERNAGITEAVVGRQIDALVDACTPLQLAQCVLAYEPVWAIGTGRTATPEQAQEVHVFIRRRLEAVDASLARRMSVLYGGSIKSSNAAELFAMPDVDGGLVGGASLVMNEFLSVYQAAQ
jgi:triosephosphate isomerase